MLIESNVRSFFDVVFGGPYEEIGVRRRIWTASRAAPIPASVATLMSSARVDGIAEAIEGGERAPFTSEPCVYWHVRLIGRRVMQGMNLGINTASPEVWSPQLVLSSRSSFWLVQEDGTRVLVEVEDPEGATHARESDDDAGDTERGERDSVVAVAPLEDVSDHPCVNEEDEHLNVFLRSHEIVPIEEMGRSGEYRFLEARIVPGQRITVWGRVAELPSRVAAGYRDAASTIRRLTATTADPLIIIVRG
jgi:hypothetical protein